ncbi:MAG: transposase [Clostridiaceae bacterium BRH_c20a]|nr:MAG: transposase [Clostridiaceae bacterium BRH_c20a]
MANKNPDTEGIKTFATKKSEETLQKVQKAIQTLIKSRKRINFNTVSIEAGVTKSYLYNNPEIRTQIETLRKQQKGLPISTQKRENMTNSSKDIIIAAKNKKIMELEAENKQLKEDLKKLRGKLYESLI